MLSQQWYIKGMSRLHINTFAVQLLLLPSQPFQQKGMGGDKNNNNISDDHEYQHFTRALQDGAIASLGGGKAKDKSHHRSAGGSAIYHVGSMFNHSCTPNVHACWPTGTSTVSFRTLRDVQLGEELLISYIDADMSYERRQASLLFNYGFSCECPKCDEEKHQ